MFAVSRTSAGGHSRSRNSRAERCSASCSSESPKSIILRGSSLARQSEAPLGDDVLLDLRRPAADDEPEREHVVERPDSAIADAGIAAAERAVRAEDVERGPRQV